MPNAAATFDDDLGYEPTPRKSAPRKPRAGAPAGKKKTARKRRLDLHRVARVAAIGMAAVMALGIMVNALVLQKGHHPAPLFGHAVAPLVIHAKAEATAPLPPARAAQTDEAPAATTSKARKTVVAAREAATDGASDDAIGRLLAGGSKGAAKGEVKSDAKIGAKSETKTVGGVQRALRKLGFKVPATGAVGPATKKAIEAFEKDRHLPVKGEVDRRLVKVLAAESGIKID